MAGYTCSECNEKFYDWHIGCLRCGWGEEDMAVECGGCGEVYESNMEACPECSPSAVIVGPIGFAKYTLCHGKFGPYFRDEELGIDLGLANVLNILNQKSERIITITESQFDEIFKDDTGHVFNAPYYKRKLFGIK